MGLSLEVMPDSGAPQVGVTVDGFTSSVLTVEWTVDGGRTWAAVRGADGVSATGGLFVRDHLAPLNLLVTYRVTVISGDTPTGALEESITVPSASAWIQDPLNPRLAVPISLVSLDDGNMVAYGSLMSAVYKQQADTVTPMGASRPVASVGRRMLAGEVPLTLVHEIAAEGGLLRNLLLRSGVVVIRGLPDGLLEPVAHVVLGDVSETRTAPRGIEQLSTFELKATQVQPPALRIVVPWWTYDQVKALYEGVSYDAALAGRPGDTYLQWLRDPMPA